jgi:hypothetical protein
VKNLVVERKKTREEVVSLLLFDVVMFLDRKRRYRKKFWFGTFDMFVFLDALGNEDGITGNQCLIW